MSSPADRDSASVPSTPQTAAAAQPPTQRCQQGGPRQQQPAAAVQLRTCRRCKQAFDPSTNGPHSCRYHSALWTGGEVSKALGFCRQSDRPEHQLRVVVGKTGLIRWVPAASPTRGQSKRQGRE